VRPSARSYPASNIGSTATSTTARKILTNRPANGNDACSGLNLPDTPNASFPPMVPSRHTSDLAATGSLPQRIARRWVNDSRSGEKSGGWLLPHKCQAGCSPPGLVMVLKHVNLTTPSGAPTHGATRMGGGNRSA
jgi:hypothetical protein